MDNYSIIVENISLTYRSITSASLRPIFSFGKKQNQSRVELIRALKNVSFKVQRGDNIGVIGSNGSGKSTLLKTLAGVFQPDSGKITINSDSISLLALGAGFELELTGIQNIYLNGVLLGIPKKELDKRLEEIKKFSGIGDFVYKPVRTYSSGMRSRLAFSIASNIEPDILLLDEMLGVGDEDFREKSSKRIKELINSHRTVILVSHTTSTVRDLCNEILWLERGEVMEFGKSDIIVRHYLDYVRKKREEMI